MKAYIVSSGVISPQKTHDSTGFPAQIFEAVTNRLRCVEPDYKEMIEPIRLRRMPRILKMGLASAKICLDHAGNMVPDAIIVGTGLGCLDDLEKFLMDILNTDERVTSVLPFINSTHNAVASLIAMAMKNFGYNYTYCHRSFSFESALQDALMHIAEKSETCVLAGGIDECTDDFIKLHHYLGYWKQPLRNLDLFEDKNHGTIAGEGSAFFLLSNRPFNQSSVILEGVYTYFVPEEIADPEKVFDELNRFLKEHNTDKSEIDIVILGLTGDCHYDVIYHQIRQRYFKGSACFTAFKHLCGEFYTASAFAFWLAVTMISDQKVPDAIMLDTSQIRKINKVLIYNHFKNTEHALMLLALADETV